MVLIYFCYMTLLYDAITSSQTPWPSSISEKFSLQLLHVRTVVLLAHVSIWKWITQRSTCAIPAEVHLGPGSNGSARHKDIPSHERLAFPFDQWGQYLNLIWYFKVNIKSKGPLFILSLRGFKYKCGLNSKSALLWKVDYFQFLSLA